MTRVNLGETETERTLIESIYTFADDVKAEFDCLVKDVTEGEFVKVTLHFARIFVNVAVAGEEVAFELTTPGQLQVLIDRLRDLELTGDSVRAVIGEETINVLEGWKADKEEYQAEAGHE